MTWLNASHNYCQKILFSGTPILFYRGTYRDQLKGEDLASCSDCPQGYYCPTAITTEPLPCGKGNYSASGAIVCTSCAVGRYCNVNATGEDFMNKYRICPAGVECPGGMSYQPQLETDPCRIGHYCPRGDINPLPVPCPVGTFNGEIGREQVSECEPCRAGWYCNAEGLTEPQDECPGGYYCPKGTGDYTVFPCPIGFYRNGSAKESFQDCTQCYSGYYCDEEGLAVPKDCPRGMILRCFRLM